MADVFISYAREDREFARRLVDALTEHGRECWIDWKDIEPSEEWWRAITEASDAADAIVFICSPDSLASEVCQRELAHAAAHHKRLIPVVARDIEGLKAPDELAQLNYVFLREQDDWDEGIAKLIRALDLDLELVRVQTRVLTRAEAWRLSGRRTTPLLRGDELRAAERWLAHAASGGEPQPTDLQGEFIAASRQVASRRQRQAIIGSLSVAAVAISLAIFAFIQRSEARHQAKLAESRQDAAGAEASLSADPEDSISLAAAGLRIASTPQAIHALWSALSASRLRAVLRDSGGPVYAVAFSPDGTRLAVGSADGTVRLWDVADRRLLWSSVSHLSAAASLSFSGSGDLLAVGRAPRIDGRNGCSVDVLSAATGQGERTLGPSDPSSDACFREVSFVGSSAVVAVGGVGGSIQFLNAGTGQQAASPLSVFPATGSIVSGVAISPDGKELAAINAGPYAIRVMNLMTGAQIAQFVNNASGLMINPNAIAFSPDGSQLLVAGEYDTEIYDLTEHKSFDLYAQDAGTTGAAWAGDGRVMAAGGLNDSVDVWSYSFRPVETLSGNSEAQISDVAMTRTGVLAGGAADGTVRIWAADPDLPDHSAQAPASIGLGYAGNASDAKLVAIGDTEPQSYPAKSSTGGVVVVNDAGERVNTVSVTGDGPFAVTTTGQLVFTRNGTLRFAQLPGGRATRSVSVPAIRFTSTNGSIDSVSTSSTGTTTAILKFTGSDFTITIVSPQGIRTATTTDRGDPISISPDGRFLAVPTPSGVEVLATHTLRVARTEPGIAVTYSPTGSVIAIQRHDLSIAILSTSNWKTLTNVRGQPTPADWLSFSPDDRLVSALGDDGVVRAWATSDGALVGSRHTLEISQQAQRYTPPESVMTGAGYAIEGTPLGVSAYNMCNECLSASALLAQAHARLNEIAPVTASR